MHHRSGRVESVRGRAHERGRRGVRNLQGLEVGYPHRPPDAAKEFLTCALLHLSSEMRKSLSSNQSNGILSVRVLKAQAFRNGCALWMTDVRKRVDCKAQKLRDDSTMIDCDSKVPNRYHSLLVNQGTPAAIVSSGEPKYTRDTKSRTGELEALNEIHADFRAASEV